MTRRIAELEARFLELRDAHDAQEVADARGEARADGESALAAALDDMRGGLAAVDDGDLQDEEDLRAVAEMRRVLDEIDAGRAALPVAR
jgi:hypothetical protein